MKKLIIFILSICLFIALTACGRANESETKKINAPIGSNEFNGKTYDEVEEMFKNAGFTNIEKSEINDLDNQEKEFLVSSIKINEDSNFTIDNTYSDDSKVTIEYHKQKDIEMPKSSYELKKDKYTDVVQSLEDLGFSNIQTKAVNSNYESLRDKVDNIKINGRYSFKKGDKFPIESNIIIEYYIASNETNNFDEDDEEIDRKSNPKLSISKAKKTFEKYGRKVWRKGFNCHWALGIKEKKELSDDSWYFRVKVTIKEENGNKRDAVAEGVVTGDNISSEVLKFDIVG